MGEETKVEKMFMTLEDGTEVEWDGIKSVTTELFDYKFYKDEIALGPYEWSFTATTKYPKFWRCTNRKRYKKLMMSLGYSRDLVEVYLQLYSFLRQKIEEYNPSYQELWDEVRINTFGI